jgi:hypothetical protein
MIRLISASWVARIIGVSHQHPAGKLIFKEGRATDTKKHLLCFVPHGGTGRREGSHRQPRHLFPKRGGQGSRAEQRQYCRTEASCPHWVRRQKVGSLGTWLCVLGPSQCGEQLEPWTVLWSILQGVHVGCRMKRDGLSSFLAQEVTGLRVRMSAPDGAASGPLESRPWARPWPAELGLGPGAVFRAVSAPLSAFMRNKEPGNNQEMTALLVTVHRKLQVTQAVYCFPLLAFCSAMASVSAII